MYRRLARLFLLVLTPLTLAACGSTVQQTFGLDRRAPDEFAVVRRAPLTVPPNLRELPPPQPGAPRPQERPTSEQVRDALTGSAGTSSEPQRFALTGQGLSLDAEDGGPSPTDTRSRSEGERALVQTIPVEAEPEIRRTLLEENTQLAQLDEQTYLFILNFQRQLFAERRDQPALLDAEAENRRLQGYSRATTTRLGSTPLQTIDGTGS